MDISNKFLDITTSRIKVRAGPDGLHFFNRNTGINILFNELILSANMWSVAPRQVSVALTNSCDLSCPHCYAPKYPAILDFDKLTHWLIELDTNGCIGVGFGGGEPTLYPRLVELCSFATRETNLAVTMTTHGHLLNNKLLQNLAGNLHFIRISMDGVGSTYESIRNRSFNALLDRISALRCIVPFGINFLVNSRTIGDLDAVVQIAENLGASEILLLPEEPVGRGHGIDNISTTLMQNWVNEYYGSVNLVISEGRSEGLPICNPLVAEKGLAAFAHINASGLLKRTSYERIGIPIQENGVMAALDYLATIK